MGDRVLIVEDEARLREILCDYFSAKGEQPVGAENGQAALDYLRDHTVDAVLLDILMPELDGFTVCRAVRKQSSVPIIFLTALSDEDDKLRGYELGADDYVTKRYIRQERYAGAMSRSFYVGEGVTVDDMKAKFEDGILQISVPKTTVEALPKKNILAIE